MGTARVRGRSEEMMSARSGFGREGMCISWEGGEKMVVWLRGWCLGWSW